MPNLALKYRPRTFDRIIGQDDIVASVKDVLRKKSCQCFMFAGEPGLGKTSLSRIVAREMGCSKNNLREVDSAVQTGVDEARTIADSMRFNALGQSSVRVVIYDEAHKLSSAAFQSLQKIVEEPPKHTGWIFCTTEPGKIPRTIVTRCVCYTLRPVDSILIAKRMRSIAKKESLEVSRDVIEYIARHCGGSVRQALTCLGQCGAITDVPAAKRLLRQAEPEGEAILLCRALARGCGWAEALGIVKSLGDLSPESVRFVVSSYFTKMALGAEHPKRAEKALAVLSAFSEPYPPTATMGHVLMSLGELLL